MLFQEGLGGAARNQPRESIGDPRALVVATGPRFLRMERNGYEDRAREVPTERLIGGGRCHQIIGEVG